MATENIGGQAFKERGQDKTKKNEMSRDDSDIIERFQRKIIL